MAKVIKPNTKLLAKQRAAMKQALTLLADAELLASDLQAYETALTCGEYLQQPEDPSETRKSHLEAVAEADIDDARDVICGIWADVDRMMSAHFTPDNKPL